MFHITALLFPRQQPTALRDPRPWRLLWRIVLRLGRAETGGTAGLLRCGGCDGEVGEAARAVAGVCKSGGLAFCSTGWGDHSTSSSDRRLTKPGLASQ